MLTYSRRNFVKTLSLGLGSASTLLSAHHAEAQESAPSQVKTILFQGDSITDAGRNKESMNPNTASALGTGYAALTAATLLGKFPAADLKIYNKGISGNKVYQLAERWDKECLELKPDVLSILIGVNDFWHKLNGRYDGTAEIYERDYRALLERTRQALPNIKLIICQPFAVKGGTAINEKWFPDFTAYQDASRKIAGEFGAVFLPFQDVFDQALKQAPATYWCPDGVHPSPAGNFLMAQAWLKAAKGAMRG